MAMLDAKMTALAQQFLRNEALVDQVAIEAIRDPAAAVELCAIMKLFAALAIDLETALALSRGDAENPASDAPADADGRWTLPQFAGNGSRYIRAARRRGEERPAPAASDNRKRAASRRQ